MMVVMARPPRRTRRSTALVVLATLATLAAACSKDDGGEAARRRQQRQERKRDEQTQGGPVTTTRPGSGRSPVRDGIRIEVLSSQPDRVSGDDARVRVTPAEGGSVEGLRIERDGVEVTGALAPSGGSLEGVVRGFVEGTNTLTATEGSQSVSQRVRAWPLTGPVVSGPHLPLLVCSTEANGLGPPTDDDCSAPTKVTWKYLDRGHRLHDLPSLTAAPADIGSARIGGKDVPLYVRHEQGVINRSVYEIASIDATPGDDDPLGPGWNDKLLYRYGGGCGTSYGQGTSLTTALDPTYLVKGYALATATFNTFQVQCNDVLSAETTMMVKERVIEEFGAPDFTIGEGASGGAIQLHLMVQNYPGLVDGVVASLPFPDALSMAGGVTDCGLLLHYYESAAGRALTEAQRTAVNGHATAKTCETWRDTFLETLDPTNGCDPAIPASQLYDAARNPGGLRCSLQDANRNQLGTDPETGFALRPLDNVGVQYGLTALEDRAISVDEFLDLNAAIGGYDIDGRFQTAREEADPDAVLHAYETGRVANGGGDLLDIPIIDINVFTDPAGDIHDRFRAFSLRDRLDRVGGAGGSPGFQIWTRDPGDVGLDAALANAVSGGGYGPAAVAAVDDWLTALTADRSSDGRRQVLEDARPDVAVDNCLLDGAKTPVGGLRIYERKGPCRDEFPLAGDPRVASGAPRTDDVIKCELKPVDPSDYDVRLTSAQLDRLTEIFPTGVCDHLQPGVGETVPANPDRSYEDVISPGQNA